MGDAAIMIHLEFFTHVTTTANLMGKHLSQSFPNTYIMKTIERKQAEKLKSREMKEG